MGSFLETDDNSTSSTKNYLVEVVSGLAILFATIWVVGKAWKKSQK
jgi:succinate dehydrogenase hydrophobic anchor subunit